MKKMIGDRTFMIGIFAMMLLVILSVGCVEEKSKIYSILGLEKLNANDELNIVNLTVQGLQGEPKLNTVNFEFKNAYEEVIWSGNAVTYIEIPSAMGVYYIDVNQNDKIDVGDTFCVKAPEDGFFTLNWNVDGNPGQFNSDF